MGKRFDWLRNRKNSDWFSHFAFKYLIGSRASRSAKYIYIYIYVYIYFFFTLALFIDKMGLRVVVLVIDIPSSVFTHMTER